METENCEHIMGPKIMETENCEHIIGYETGWYFFSPYAVAILKEKTTIYDHADVVLFIFCPDCGVKL
jgi:hypothetical protein